jgi:hypothetical protein
MIYCFQLIFAVLFFINNTYSLDDPVKLNLNGLKVVADKEIANRDAVLTSLNKLLDQALLIDFVVPGGKISYKARDTLKSLTRKINKQTELLKESSRKVKFYAALIEVFESEYSNGSIKSFFADKISGFSRSELMGLVDYPDKKENTLFFMNLAVALKSVEVPENEVWFFIKDFSDFVTIGNPKSLASYFALRETRYKTKAFKIKSNKVPEGLPVRIKQ